MIGITQEEQKRRRHTAKVALKHLELEGMYPSKEMLKDVALLIKGKITDDQVLSRGIERAKEIDRKAKIEKQKASTS